MDANTLKLINLLTQYFAASIQAAGITCPDCIRHQLPFPLNIEIGQFVGYKDTAIVFWDQLELRRIANDPNNLLFAEFVLPPEFAAGLAAQSTPPNPEHRFHLPPSNVYEPGIVLALPVRSLSLSLLGELIQQEPAVAGADQSNESTTSYYILADGRCRLQLAMEQGRLFQAHVLLFEKALEAALTADRLTSVQQACADLLETVPPTVRQIIRGMVWPDLVRSA